MAHSFRRDGDRYVVKLRSVEAGLLRGLVADVERLLAGDAPPNDVTRRLLPDPSTDPRIAGELRELIEDDLRAGKIAAAQAMRETLAEEGRIALDQEQAEIWATVLNDVRLALGTAIGVTEDEHDADDPSFALYDWLTWLQGTLVDALSGGLGDRQV